MRFRKIEIPVLVGILRNHPDLIHFVPFPDLEGVVQIVVQVFNQVLLIVHILHDGQRLQCRKVHLHCQVGIAAAALQIEHIDLVALGVCGAVPVRNDIGDFLHNPLAFAEARSVDADRHRKIVPLRIVVNDAPVLQLRSNLALRFSVITVILCPDNAVCEVDHAARRLMDAADVEQELSVHENPHIIVAAVLEGDRLRDIGLGRVDELRLHGHAEVVVVAVAVEVRISSRRIIFIEGEEADLETFIFVPFIYNRVAVTVELNVVCITVPVVIVVDDLESLIVNIKFLGVGVEVSVVFVAVVEQVTVLRIPLQQVVDIGINGLVRALIHIPLCIVGARCEQIREAVAGTRNLRISVLAERGVHDTRDRPVARIHRIGIVVTCIAVHIRLVLMNAVIIPVVIDIGILAIAVNRRTHCKEQDVSCRISAGVDAGVSPAKVTAVIRLRMRPDMVVFIPAVYIAVVLRFELAAAVIEQRELDALGDVVDRRNGVQRDFRIARCSERLLRHTYRLDHMAVCIDDAADDHIVIIAGAVRLFCCNLRAGSACVAVCIVNVLGQAADQRPLPALVTVRMLCILLQPADKPLLIAGVGVDMLLRFALRFVRHCQANAVECPRNACGNNQ